MCQSIINVYVYCMCFKTIKEKSTIYEYNLCWTSKHFIIIILLNELIARVDDKKTQSFSCSYQRFKHCVTLEYFYAELYT